MAIVALLSAKGSPGVTTTALACALSWRRRLVLAECDPAGGSILAGYLGGALEPARPGRAGRRGAREAGWNGTSGPARQPRRAAARGLLLPVRRRSAGRQSHPAVATDRGLLGELDRGVRRTTSSSPWDGARSKATGRYRAVRSSCSSPAHTCPKLSARAEPTTSARLTDHRVPAGRYVGVVGDGTALEISKALQNGHRPDTGRSRTADVLSTADYPGWTGLMRAAARWTCR